MGQIATLHSIADVMRHPKAAELIAEAKGHVTKGMSGEQLLSLADEFIPGTKVGGEIGQRLWSKLGVKSATRREAVFPDTPYGYVVLALLCACARQNLALDELTEPAPGAHALIAATVPSSILAFAGEILIDIQADGRGFTADGRTIFQGQAFDWGRGGRLLDTLFERAGKAVRTYQTLDL